MSQKRITKIARQLRQDMTVPEQLLWGAIRNRWLAGLKFRRQHPVGPYIIDFTCEEHQLIIELDGESHNGRFEYDQQRQRYLESFGYRVLRFSNDEVLQDLESVLEEILLACGIPLDQNIADNEARV